MEALNVSQGLFLGDDGETYPITNWIGADGDECDRESAVACVAGKDDRWFALTLSDFDGRTQ